MKEKALILLKGYYKDYKNNEIKQSEILGILEPTTGIIKGIEVQDSDCNIENYEELLNYIYHGYTKSQTFSLIVGYYDGKLLQYRGLLSEKEIPFGEFELCSEDMRLKGREKKQSNKKLTRNLERPVNRYDTIVLLTQLESRLGFFRYFSTVYELIEAILIKENNNLGWKGLQLSMEAMAPKAAEKTYMLTLSIDEVK